MNEFHQQEQLTEIRELLFKRNYELMELQSQLKQLDKQIETLVEHNARLQRFADAVRGTMIYRIYCKSIRPLRGRGSRVGSERH